MREKGVLASMLSVADTTTGIPVLLQCLMAARARYVYAENTECIVRTT